MADEDIKEEQQKVEEGKKSKRHKSIIIYALILPLIIIVCVVRLILISPISAEDLYCKYSSKFSKITCTQTGDVVPKWLKYDDGGIFGNKYSMELIVTQKDGNYETFKMTDSVFIADLKRKFIYEVKEQTVWDYLEFKTLLNNGSIGNWGSNLLYCSETNLQDKICKNMKKYAE